jgi:hypothetical protein
MTSRLRQVAKPPIKTTGRENHENVLGRKLGTPAGLDPSYPEDYCKDRLKVMKTNRFVLCVALTLSATTASFQARACGFGFHVGLPCISLGVGLGLGLGCSYPVYECGYGWPAYTYAQPTYTYGPAADYPSPAATAPAAPVVSQPSAWAPTTPGVGHWVPDPAPYRYTPAPAARRTSAAAPPAAETVTVTSSLGGVPVYRVQVASQQR